jgi:ABC-2 type transport system permease protein
VLCFAVTFSGMLSAASLVWDRELGFLRELTIAPVSRASILAMLGVAVWRFSRTE